MQDFTYHFPKSIEEAIRLLDQEGALALAGGTDLIPQLRERRRTAKHVVDVKHVADMQALAQASDGSWRIGAAVSVGHLARHPAFSTEHPALVEAASLIGSLQIQNRASLGGNICNAAPSADAVPMLAALDAQAEIAGPGGRRIIPVTEMGIGPGRTSLKAGELLVAIQLPARSSRSGAKYLRFTPRREMDIAVAGAAANLEIDAAGYISNARIALASVAPRVIMASAAMTRLRGQRPTKSVLAEAAAAASTDATPISDTRGSADFRRDLVVVLTRRALTAAAQRAGIDPQ